MHNARYQTNCFNVKKRHPLTLIVRGMTIVQRLNNWNNSVYETFITISRKHTYKSLLLPWYLSMYTSLARHEMNGDCHRSNTDGIILFARIYQFKWLLNIIPKRLNVNYTFHVSFAIYFNKVMYIIFYGMSSVFDISWYICMLSLFCLASSIFTVLLWLCTSRKLHCQ